MDLTKIKFPDTIKNIAIYNASHATTELNAALLLALRSVHPHPERVNIVTGLVYDDETTLFIILCAAGLGSDKYVPTPIHYITYQLDPSMVFEKAPYRKLLTGAIYNWEYSNRNIEYCADKYDLKLHYVPPGYVETLSPIHIIDGTYLYSDAGKDIDVLFLGWDVYPRRAAIRDAFGITGLKIWFVCTLDINGMKEAIRRAKVCINIHHIDDMPIFQSIRMSILLSNQSCIVSEDIKDPEIEIYGDNVIFVPYQDLVPKCVELVKDPEKRRTQAIKSYQWYRRNRYWNRIVDFNALLPSLDQRSNVDAHPL
ncbi:Hypothetical protein HVR_LOCUS290 [uncultured virus]|nr:Hypothetical protein HVR_LOCUS290 [uncultured virus]